VSITGERLAARRRRRARARRRRTSRRAQSGTKLGAARQRQRLGGEIVDVAHAKELAGHRRYDRLARRRDVAGEQRAAAGLGLLVRQRKAFALGGMHDDVHQVQVAGDDVVRHRAREAEAGRGAPAARRRSR